MPNIDSRGCVHISHPGFHKQIIQQNLVIEFQWRCAAAFDVMAYYNDFNNQDAHLKQLKHDFHMEI